MGRMALIAVVFLFLCTRTADAQAPHPPLKSPKLPDVDVSSPYGLIKTTDRTGKSYVAFDSYVANLGEGPLKLLGQRASTSAPMKVKQVLLDAYSLQRGRVARTVPAGEMQFSPSASHNHWHYL